MGIETQTSAAVIQLVESGAGISIIDPLTASAYSGERLKFIPFEPSIVDSYSILISQRNSSTLILKPFVDQVRKEIRKIVPKHLIV
jgi:DNA-binding transcriptional LysR family regulator